MISSRPETLRLTPEFLPQICPERPAFSATRHPAHFRPSVSRYRARLVLLTAFVNGRITRTSPRLLPTL